MSGWNWTRAAFWNGTSREQQTDCGTAFPEKEKPPIDQQELWSHKCKQGFQRKWNESLKDGHGKFPSRKIQIHCIPVKMNRFFKKIKICSRILAYLVLIITVNVGYGYRPWKHSPFCGWEKEERISVVCLPGHMSSRGLKLDTGLLVTPRRCSLCLILPLQIGGRPPK